jgi:hypothetical protein
MESKGMSLLGFLPCLPPKSIPSIQQSYILFSLILLLPGLLVTVNPILVHLCSVALVLG